MVNYQRIGVIGGLSPQSSMLFYKKIIDKHYQKFNDQYYPEIVMFSVNFDKVKDLQKSFDQTEYVSEFVKATESLENAGADFAVIASNTPHRVFKDIERRSSIKLLSIVDCVANYISTNGFKKVLLLGTIYTMKEKYYKVGLEARNILNVVPNDEEQEAINDIIFTELVLGYINESSRLRLYEIINQYEVDAVVLGCTELPLIVKKEDLNIPVIDTTDIFAEAVLNYAII